MARMTAAFAARCWLRGFRSRKWREIEQFRKLPGNRYSTGPANVIQLAYPTRITNSTRLAILTWSVGPHRCLASSRLLCLVLRNQQVHKIGSRRGSFLHLADHARQFH